MRILVAGWDSGGGVEAVQTVVQRAVRRGHQVRVLEKAAQFAELGAGLQLAPNATRILSRLGVLDRVLEAGPARLRAILMTSATIVAALLPSAFQLGEGSEIRAPLAATVVGGVIASTLLTLVVVPTMYTILDSVRGRSARFAGGGATRKTVPPEGTGPMSPVPPEADGTRPEPVGTSSSASPHSRV